MSGCVTRPFTRSPVHPFVIMTTPIATTNGLVRRLVIKLGTNVLTAGSDHLHRPRMVDLARQIAEARARGVEVVLVSSGAVAADAASACSSRRAAAICRSSSCWPPSARAG